MASRIRQLPEEVANRIAAGEVVERPVAVIKELVENALDAGATDIEVQFDKGGKASMRVTDNGCGMSPEEAVLALRRHATSKIKDVPDILKVTTFGFRGEALPSIASVSRFLLRTRTREADSGTELRTDRQGRVQTRSHGMSPGTEVIVQNLFHTVPARRKFLKTDKTESAHIIQTCRLLAVAHPEVAFSLIGDGYEIFRSPACPDRLQRVREIFGRRRAEELLPFNSDSRQHRIFGLLGRPGVGRGTRSEMITYVNQRPVQSRLLDYAVIESYHRYLPRGRYPVAFLFLDVPPSEVDVNVHPAKREVRFHNEPALRQIVMSALAGFLQSHTEQTLGKAERATPAPDQPPEGPDSPSSPQPFPATSTQHNATPPPPHLHPPPTNPASPLSGFAASRETPHPPPASQSHPAPESATPSTNAPFPWSFQGTVQRRLGLFSSPNGLIILNPRAARERVLLESIQNDLQQGQPPSQTLLLPAVIELPPLEASLLSDQLDFFQNLGFSLEAFGRHAFRLRAVPAWLADPHPPNTIEFLLGRIRDRGLDPADWDAARLWIARMAAAREAPRTPPANPADWEHLARSLLQCQHPLLDARGRPTFLDLPHTDLARKLMLDDLGDIQPFAHHSP